jgi:hypothetical protein
MRDIPVFCSAFGAASLILKKIPYTKEAYIHIRDTQTPDDLLQECVDFCKAAGAEKIYATGHESLLKYPRYTTLLHMQCAADFLEETDAALFPVQENTAEQWRGIYNEKMLRVPTATYLTSFDMKKIAEEGNAYFVHRGQNLLGIGLLRGSNIDAIASVVKGAGETVLLALCSAAREDTLTLTVADNNLPAVNLYRRLGFLTVKELESWYKII